MQWKDCPPALLRGRFAGNGLLLIRAFLQQNQRAEAQRVLALMSADPVTDTTPAYRLACALLSENPEEAARLRKDALLLAMLHRHVDYSTYADYLAEHWSAHRTWHDLRSARRRYVIKLSDLNYIIV